jgi:hypothetical protein
LCDDSTQALALVREHPAVRDATIFGDAIHALAGVESDAGALESYLQRQGVRQVRCRSARPSLEDVFVTLTRLHRNNSKG